MLNDLLPNIQVNNKSEQTTNEGRIRMNCNISELTVIISINVYIIKLHDTSF